MKFLRWLVPMGLLGLVAIVGTLGGCALVSYEPELSPQEVVAKFYRWYIGYPGNPLVDREYRESPYLANSFVQELDETLDGGLRADPILLAQDVPERFSVEEAEISDDEATVTISLYWGGNPMPTQRRVDLDLIDGEWKISDVSLIY